MEAAALQEASKAGTRANVRVLMFPDPNQVEAKKAMDAGMAQVTTKDPGQSKQQPEDPIEALTLTGELLAPPFDLLTLATLPEHSTELGPCVEAMETNIEGFGHHMVSRVPIDDPKVQVPPEVKAAVRRERVRLENFFAYACAKDSWIGARRKLRKDLETTGNAYLEPIRNGAGEIHGLEHAAAYQIRITRMDRKPILVDVPILELQEDGSVKVVMMPQYRRFRRFVQSVYGGREGYMVRWFKEFGDPREYHLETGVEIPKADLPKVPPEMRANELIHFKLYCTRSPYGLPRFIGNLLSIYGDRAAEEINYVTFRNNNIPSMAILVSNGQLTEGSINRINTFVESAIKGSDNYSKILILEAEGAEEGEDAGNIKIEMKPLVDSQHRDALFQNYSKGNQDKIRRAFRLPPILVGRADDYTRAVADTSVRVADEQVFAPERDEFDHWVNMRLFPAMGVIYHRFKSNTPNTTDNTELVQILSGAEKTGGMTPRIARMVLEDILGRELGEFPPEVKPDVPFSLAMAEAVKNQADPTEPGQQVTAIKILKSLGILGDEPDTKFITEEMLVARLTSLRANLEKQWRAAVEQGD